MAALPGCPLSFRLRVERVKCGADAGVALAHDRLAAPTAAANMAQRGAALLVPPAVLIQMGKAAGETSWLCDEQRGWFVLVRVWSGDKVQRAGCRLLLPSHSSTPLVDGCTAQLHPLLQSSRRASTVHLRPVAPAKAANSTLMQKVMSSVLAVVLGQCVAQRNARVQCAGSGRVLTLSHTVVSHCALFARLLFVPAADRSVYEGEEVCVTLFDEKYSFIVASVDADPAAHGEQEEKKGAAVEDSDDAAALLQRLALDPFSAAAAATAAAAADPAPCFPRLYAVHSTTRVALAAASAPSATGSASSFAAAAAAASSPSEVISADSIGGLEKEIGDLRKLLSLSLEEPHLFTNLGITPPRGILLYGPPGTGRCHRCCSSPRHLRHRS